MRRTAVHVLVLTVVALLAYSNTFDVPFQFDDNMYVKENPLIKDARFLFNPSESDRLKLTTDVAATRTTRFMGYLTFFLNYSAHKLEVTGYHVVNIAVHFISALLVYLLVKLTFKTPFMEGSRLRGREGHIAICSALLFVSHPVQTGAITYVTQRFTSLAAMFYLLSLASYAAYRLSGRSGRRYGIYALCLASAVAAMTTKEISFTLPVAVALYELMFFEGPARRRAINLIPLALTMVIIPLSLMDFDRPLGEALGGATVTASPISRHDYFVTQSRVLVTYLRLLALPVGQNLDYDYPVSASFLSAGVLLSSVFLLGILAAGAWMFRRSRQGSPEMRIMSFGLFWFFLTLSVESSVIVLADVIFEHRLYLPSMGVFPVLAVGAFLLMDGMRGRGRKAAMALLVLLPVVFASAAYARNELWRSEITLWEDVVRKSPQKARGYNNLGRAHWSRREVDRAVGFYRTALTLKPKFALAHNNMGVAYGYKNMHDRAIMHFQAAIRYDPDNVEAHFNLGVKYIEKGLNTEARREFEAVLKVMPYHPQARRFLKYALEQERARSR